MSKGQETRSGAHTGDECFSSRGFPYRSRLRSTPAPGRRRRCAVVDMLRAVARHGADGCIVLVDESSHADVRFALNTTTTNGVRRDRSCSVLPWAGCRPP